MILFTFYLILTAESLAKFGHFGAYDQLGLENMRK